MLNKNDLAGLRFIFFMAIPLFLGGCVAAIPAMTAGGMAASGFGVFKLVQLETGGSVEISFADEELIHKERVRSIRKPAVWAGHEIEVYMTERMQSSALFSSVITPSTVSKILEKLDINSEMKMMTRMEKTGVLRKVCRSTRADAIVMLESLGSQMDISYFSFDRMNTSIKARMTLYGCQPTNAVAYKSVTEIKTNIGSTLPSEHEIAKIAGDAIAEKLIQLVEGKEPTVTDSPTEIDEEVEREKKPNFDFLKGIFSKKN
uniref:Uncharacterized protein n=1 Tax=Candidatus Kentrum sp. FW TaxID=2126338 RepID=A0A450TSC0_9GAMM|nr:MAG: hypothetical protein BECKFW1821B_GA0114236_12134 [Candidatus Kentron sp. FW]